jgi:hypothetical protein
VMWPILGGWGCYIKNVIELKVGANPIIITPYKHSKMFKDEIEKAI